MLKNYLRVTLRNIVKNKTYSFLNIFGLAIGVACAGIIFLWVEDEVHYDDSFAKKDRICRVMTNQTFNGVTRTFRSTPGLLAPSIKKEIPGIANSCRTARSNNAKPLFSLGDKTVYEEGLYVDSSFLDMFTLQFVQGRAEGALRDLNSVVISEKMAKQFFGNEQDAIGRNLKVDNSEDRRITGIFKDLPANSTTRFDWVSPFEIYSKTRDWLKYWGANSPSTYIELAPGANFDAVNRQLAGFIHAKDNAVSSVAILYAMKDWRLRDNFVEGKLVGGRIVFVRLFAVIAWIILLIACINFMNLATARSEKRAREVGVRKVLGAGKGALVGQFIGEAMAMAILSVLLGLALISILLPSFNILVEKQLTPGLAHPLHSAALVMIAIFCGLVAGSYPSLYLSSFNPIHVFKGLRGKEGGATSIRKGLVVFQFTVSIALIVCTILVYQQVEHIRSRDLGYNKDNLLDMKITGTMQKDFAAIRQDLVNTGVVGNAALCSTESLDVANNTSGLTWDGKDPNSVILVSLRQISPEYMSTMGMPIVDGRNFHADIKSDSMNILITETMARLMGKGSAIGKTIRSNDQSYQVVGVIKDYVYGDMYGQPDPVIFFSQPDQTEYFYIRYKAKTRAEDALAKISAVMLKDNPAYPFDYNFVDEQFDNKFKSEALVGSLSRIFAALAIFISCLGLFGLSAYTAERRTKEIGIRKLLGASVSGITGLLSRDFLRLVLLSNLVAIPLSWWVMHNWLLNYAYRIGISVWVFVAAALAAILIALITISFQSVRAALANPVTSLRTD
jgi:putative ABC transport system permease protein